MGEAPRDLSWLSLKLFLFEGVDKFDGGEESDALAVVLDGLDADRRGEMRLARAEAADQDDIVGVFQKVAAMELTCERLVDLAAGEVEAGEIAIVRKASGLELIGRRSDLPVASPPSGVVTGSAAPPHLATGTKWRAIRSLRTMRNGSICLAFPPGARASTISFAAGSTPTGCISTKAAPGPAKQR